MAGRSQHGPMVKGRQARIMLHLSYKLQKFLIAKVVALLHIYNHINHASDKYSQLVVFCIRV